MTRWLLEHGADPNVQAGLDLTPLSWAAAKASLSTIKLLFEYGADIHKGQPLHHATQRKSEITEVLAFLLEKGAPLDEEIYENHEYSRTVWGRFDAGTPLFHAIMWRNMEAIQYLVEKGADLNIKSRIGQTPHELALDVDHRENREIAALLKSTMEAPGQ
ncbi:ankyrin repeat domain-containing protein [Aspergillus stella-maris]|uniref:ankyrin repeat domain-containing protein n=1 Tax=Aspergillus stella-maris TaxID=1810926 RepID=UPI003CCCDD6B